VTDTREAGQRPVRAPLGRRSRRRWAIAGGVALCWLVLEIMTGSVLESTVLLVAIAGLGVACVAGLRAMGITADHPWLRRIASRPWRDGRDVLNVAIRHLPEVFIVTPSGSLFAPDFVELRMNPDDLDSLCQQMEFDVIGTSVTEVYEDQVAKRGARFAGSGQPEVYIVGDDSLPPGRYRLQRGLPVGARYSPDPWDQPDGPDLTDRRAPYIPATSLDAVGAGLAPDRGYAWPAAGAGSGRPGSGPGHAPPGSGWRASGPGNAKPASGSDYGQPASRPDYAKPASGPGYARPGSAQAASGPGYGQAVSGPGYGEPASGPGYGEPASGPGYGQAASGPGYGQAVSGPGYVQPVGGGPTDRTRYDVGAGRTIMDGLPTVMEQIRPVVPVLRLVTGTLVSETSRSGARAGRGPVELVLPDLPTVSREHARFTFAEGRWWVTNQGMNGLFVNGVAVSGKQPVSDGDSIRWGTKPDALQSRVEIG
jgi:FHA domain